MLNKKMIAFVATAALAGCLALAGCGGSQSASSSAASSAAASSAAASASAASQSAAASSTAASSAAASTAASSAAASPSAAASSAAASPSAAAPSASAPASSAASSAAAYIGDQAAIDIALANAGFAASDVTGLKCELDLDDAIVHYDVDFKQGGMEYDYDIDATTGAIIHSSSEVDD